MKRTRRAIVAGAIGAAASAACGAERTDPVEPSCTPYPSEQAGPYVLDGAPDRSTIVEDRPGEALTVRVELVARDTCTPLTGAEVEIWHADADGRYSGFPGQPGGVDTTGELFLRGRIAVDAAGVAAFRTIVPGWYPGRTAHVHLRITVGGEERLTTQAYFPDDFVDAIYATGAYAQHGPKDTSNEEDVLPSEASVMVIGADAAGHLATARVVV